MPTRIGVIGAGLIGRKHLGILKDDPAFEVAGIADPAPQAEAYAREHGLQYFTGTEALLDRKGRVVPDTWEGAAGRGFLNQVLAAVLDEAVQNGRGLEPCSGRL